MTLKKFITITIITFLSVSSIFSVTDPLDDFEYVYRMGLDKFSKKKAEYVKSLDAYFVQIPNKNYKVMMTEVTQKQWQTIMGNNPSYFKGENNPVEMVSWLDCVIFCNKLSEKEGLTPCYSYDRTTDTKKWNWEQEKWRSWSNEKRDKFFEKTFYKKMECDLDANGYRLPTDEEWEYAAKGGANYTYSGSDNIFEVGWYDFYKATQSTHPVGQKKANGYDLYDMSGNVWEWCWDFLRGGSYLCCTSVSNFPAPHYLDCFEDTGFRLVRTSK